MYYEIGKIYKNDEAYVIKSIDCFLLIKREKCATQTCMLDKCKGRLVGVGQCEKYSFCGYISNGDPVFNIVLDSTPK